MVLVFLIESNFYAAGEVLEGLSAEQGLSNLALLLLTP